MIRDFGDQTEEVLAIWSRVKGDNLSIGITILIFVVVGVLSGWLLYKRWEKYKRKRKLRRRFRRKAGRRK